MTRRMFTMMVWWAMVSVLWLLVLGYIAAARVKERKEVWR